MLFANRLTLVFSALMTLALLQGQLSAARPNLILVMADDMGWGETGYYNHPVLKTPNLDELAAHGLRFDQFYAGAPNCSPTRATVMTGRTNERTGVLNHGVPLRPQEMTIAQALQSAGYATAHFGKWHLNGLRGPGAPIFADDIRSPGQFGFGTWLSVTNFFDMNPIMSRQGEFEEFQGDSSEIVVAEALKFFEQQSKTGAPFFTVIWYGTPHSPFVASDEDRAPFADLDESSSNHYGELVAMDRSLGTLRKGLRDLNIADNTLLWFCSDNGGLPGITPGTVGDLRGFKNTVYEGGLRVPCIIEWPAQIQPRVTQFPACTMDIFATLAAIVGLDDDTMIEPRDGISLTPLFEKELGLRGSMIGFRHTNRAALVDNHFKLITFDIRKNDYELYNLADDRAETTNLIQKEPAVAKRMIAAMQAWNESIDNSLAGHDYPEGKVVPPDPGPRTWTEIEEYKPYLDEWKTRREYRRYIK